MPISLEQVSQHLTKADCWIIIHGKVYDVSQFLSKHPGGAKIICKLAGKDATAQFDRFHGVSILQSYIYDKSIIEIGSLDAAATAAVAASAADATRKEVEDEESVIDKYEPQRMIALQNKPPLNEVMNLYDFEYIANRTLEPIARNYYSSGVDDEVTCHENHYAYTRVFFNPRVLRDVTECDISTKLLGSAASAPFYVSSTAMQKYAHPEGEKVFSRACAKEKVIQMIPCLLSFSFEEITAEIPAGTPFWYQLYPSQHDQLNADIIRKVEASGCRGLFITVDNVYGGNREKDRRTKAVVSRLVEQHRQQSSADLKSMILIAHDDAEYTEGNESLGRRAVTWLTWEKMREYKKVTRMPFVVKGIQSLADAELAIKNGMDGIVFSNHGGRQADYSKAPLELLADAHRLGYHRKIDIYVDGGIRRGTDVIKALCLGAKGVGLGRGLLYPVATYGERGLVHAIRMLKEEIIATMRNIGVTELSQLDELYVDLTNIKKRGLSQGDDKDLYARATLPLLFPGFGEVKL